MYRRCREEEDAEFKQLNLTNWVFLHIFCFNSKYLLKIPNMDLQQYPGV